MQFKLKEEELAALIGGRQQGYDPIQQLILSKMFKDEDKKDEKKDVAKSMHFLGFEIKRKKESTGSVFMWALLVVLAFSPYISILQDWLEKSLRSALQ